ncbi:MAG: EAL domain-containing protein, partial [Oscillospiraceae bacterium]|nr:EAL domain-containing protein [Oscillospiraceae bacterium]
QPTYSLEGLRLHGAEALIRLHDTEMGELYPGEFIPIAEQCGLIDDVDDFVLREVCAFIKSGIPAQHGINCINVNLSVVQFMQPGFVAHISGIVEEFGVDKSSINLEITESVAATDYKLLQTTVCELREQGFSFSMDDFGTGYSNLQSIFSLDFDVIKIDKSMLWSADNAGSGRIILENSVNMIKQMRREILVEGVETAEQIELLSTLDVDYMQGFYFSRPVPKDAFIRIITDEDAPGKGD